MMQNTSFARPAFAHNFDGAPQAMQGNFHENNVPRAMQENLRDRGFANNFNERRDGGFSFLSPIFGLIRLAVLGLLLWIGYKFVKNSGWRLTRAQASPTPSATETSSVEVGEEKAPE
jgi:cytoskeletal protein RodZ